MAKNIDIEELRRKFNNSSIEQQIKDSKEFLEAMNPRVDCSTFPPVDQMTEEEEDYLREGLLEANKLRDSGKLNTDV